MLRKSWVIGCVFLIATFTLVAAPKSTLAQTGSIGGSIGKTDKSVSGGEEQTQKPPQTDILSDLAKVVSELGQVASDWEPWLLGGGTSLVPLCVVILLWRRQRELQEFLARTHDDLALTRRALREREELLRKRISGRDESDE
jgi:hypothetical protein